MIQKHIIKNGKDYFLVKNENRAGAIHYINWVQNKLNRFTNISIVPYNGKKYNKDLFCWIVVE